MSHEDLFPETMPASEPRVIEWSGGQLDGWGHPRATARLICTWSDKDGWKCGWFAMVDKALDEWHPSNPGKHLTLLHYPWYRLDELPASKAFGIAAGAAARGLKIVLEQMLGYVDQAIATDVRELQEHIEQQARQWLTGEGAQR